MSTREHVVRRVLRVVYLASGSEVGQAYLVVPAVLPPVKRSN